MRIIRLLLSGWATTLWESITDLGDEGEATVGTAAFQRSLQTDDYSCGSRSVYMIANHFGLGVPYEDVVAAVRTTEDGGTPVMPMIRFFRDHGLRVNHCPNMGLRALRRALERDAVVLVHLDGDHFGVVHAMSREHVYLADPSVFRQRGRRVSTAVFGSRWSRWGISVRASLS